MTRNGVYGLDKPAEPGMALDQVCTPALVIDLDAFERNLARMRDVAAASGLALRPHAKTHKSADIARLQIERGGAVGICCQKTSEAEALAAAGIDDILLANEVADAFKIERLAALATRVKLRVCVDDPQALALLSEAAVRQGVEIGCLVEIDCSGGRCGVASGPPAAHLAEQIAAAPGVRFDGVQAYHGAAQHIRGHGERQAAIKKASAKARETVAALAARGLGCPIVTGAGTGSYEFEAASGVYTELQCGSYVFMDADYARNLDASGGSKSDFEQSLFLLASVMSVAGDGRAVCDAGLKAVALDSGLPLVHGREDVAYAGPSDEHGALRDPGNVLRLGERLKLVPGHCDPTVNLHDWLVGLRGDRVESVWPVTARGLGF